MILIRVNAYWGSGELYEQHFEVLRETPAFYIIEHRGKERKVKKKGDKIFARDTAEQAKLDFIARKQMQLSHIHNHERHVNNMLFNATDGKQGRQYTFNAEGW